MAGELKRLTEAMDDAEAVGSKMASYTGGRPGDPHSHDDIKVAPELLEALRMTLSWIDSVPPETQLPAMPGFDRDYVDEIIAKATGQGGEG